MNFQAHKKALFQLLFVKFLFNDFKNQALERGI